LASRISEQVSPECGCASEQSKGKDTPSGHWEITGVPVRFDRGCFPKTEPCFPEELTDAFVEQAALPGIFGNRHASGTDIIAELGEQHLQSGKPICYTWRATQPPSKHLISGCQNWWSG
jgi:phosphopentomutase